MNIAIGKFGRSCFFDKSRWSIYAGDDSPYIFYTTLAKRFPEHKFYFIGGNDINKCREKEQPPKQTSLQRCQFSFCRESSDIYRRKTGCQC